MTARVLRVFISSTFRDMQGEREELVKRVFPEIRHVCEQRGVVWGEVDLRWGVTDEQKAEDAVLPICLAEIERTRPYFIGMLGDRYGWVPDEIPRELVEREGWLTDDAGRSVTEMEILHGVLRDPDMAGHAFFYLRDPAWTAALPGPDRGTYDEFLADGRARLAELKARVRNSGFPVREYPEPRAIGDLVRADLLALVDRLYPPEETPDPVEQGDSDQDAYARRLVAHTIERRNELIAVDVAVDAERRAPSSPVHRAAAPRRCSRPTRTTARATTRGARAPLLRRGPARRGDRARPARAPLPGALGADDVSGDLRARTRTLLKRACETRRVVLVVDGLHLIERAGGGVAWLPSPMPANLRLVAGTRPGATSGWLVQRSLTRVDLPQFDAAQRTTAATTFLAGYAKALDQTLLDRIGAATQYDPRHLRTVLDELRQHGDHFTLPAAARGPARASRPGGARRGRARPSTSATTSSTGGLVGAVLGPLAASRTSLTEAELLDLLGDGARRPLSQLQLASGSVIPDIAGRLRLGFDEVADAARRRYLTDAATVHRRVAALFAADPRTPRALEELPWQLLAAGDTRAARPARRPAVHRGGV